MSRPAQYETALLSRRRLLERLVNPGCREEVPRADGTGGRVAAALIAGRAAAAGVLTCAAAAAPSAGGKARDGGGKEDEEEDAAVLRAFLEHAALEMEEDRAALAHEAASLCRAAVRLDVGDIGAGASDAGAEARDGAAGGAARMDDPDSVDADVDAFFGDYPECVRSDYEDGGSSDSSDSEDERRRRRKRSSSPSRAASDNESEARRSGGNGRNLPAKSEGRRPRQRQRSSPDEPEPGQFPYDDGSLSRHQPPHRPPPSNDPYGRTSLPPRPSPQMESPGNGAMPRRPQSSDPNQNPYSRPPSSGGNGARGWNDYERQNQDSSWNAYGGQVGGARNGTGPANGLGAHKSNPFQTAREYAMNCDNDDDKDGGGGGPSAHGGGGRGCYRGGSGAGAGAGRLSKGPPNFIQKGIQMMHNGQLNGHAGGGCDSLPTEDYRGSQPRQPPARGGPHISEGLRKKYQPPKRSNKGGANGRKGGPGSGGGQTARPSASGSDNFGDDDDDLPEELKGLDKELIEKIQNEIVHTGEPVTFNDIAGLEDAKQTVMELVCWPMKRPDLFTGLRRGPNGLLLFGPPGTGKTLVGKAIAHESGATFFSISSSSLTSKWIGEGEKLVRTLFAVASYREPSVVFIDEIDSLLTQRKADENEASRRIKTEFLVQLDGTGTSKGRVLCVGATNRPDELDEAARRRFVKRLYIPLPERTDREVLIRTLLGKNRHRLGDKEIRKLSENTKGFSGADLRALCADAALGPIRQLGSRALDVDPDDVPPISYGHFKRALRGMKPSVAEADLKGYLDFDRKYGSKGAAATGATGTGEGAEEDDCSDDDDLDDNDN